MTTVLPSFALNRTFGAAAARFDGKLLTVSTGVIERSWRWGGHGLATVSLKDLRTGREWCGPGAGVSCDWSNPELFDSDKGAEAEWIGLEARESDDEGLTSPHLEVVAEIRYPSAGVCVKYVVWAYPGAEGLRTQLWVRALAPTGGVAGAEKRPVITCICGEPGGTADAPVISSSIELKFRLEGLAPQRRYRGVIDWIDAGGTGAVQGVELTNTDGESVLTGVGETVLPETEEEMRARPAAFELPVELRPDGQCRVVVKRTAGGSGASIRELQLYEETAQGPSLAARLDVETMRQRLKTPAEGGEQRHVGRVGRVDYIPVALAGKRRLGVGYFNDTQNRNKPETPMLRSEWTEASTIDWASLLSLEDAEGGLTMVKESHKCVNQSGVDTGSFICAGAGLANTGWGLAVGEIRDDRERWCWASWVILHEGGDDAREGGVKRFDRLRFPVQVERDMWTVACTWGHCNSFREGLDAAMEKEVLTEMDAAAQLGIDMLLIDAGWQVSPKASSWQPEDGVGWRPHPLTYPQGWKNVVAKKEALGLRLGLWGAAQHTTADDLIWNWKQIGMEQAKLDFASLENHDEMDRLMDDVRRFMGACGRRCIISWDTTENAARYGYFWAREYGNVHFLNRKPQKPDSVVYVPWLALRDFWQLAHYQNLNKWQLTIQNPEVVSREKSDAWLYSPCYCVATALMGIPEFMALPRHYSAEAKRDIRALLGIYKEHRRAIFGGTVFPIGEEPSNASWAGFQSWDAETKSGYLTLFRERLNEEAGKEIRLRMLAPATTVQITDLRSGLRSERRRTEVTGANGEVRFEIATPGEFIFLQYQRG